NDADRKAAIEFHQVGFSYGKQRIFEQLSMQIAAGRTTVLFGPSGAGKTTCLRLIAGLEQPQSGEIQFHGNPIASAAKSLPPNQRGVGFCFQEAALWAHLRVVDHILVPLQPMFVDQEERNQRCDEILEAFALQSLRERYPEQLSGGERKRLEFARAVAGDPQIMVLDEPLAGADEPRRFELMPYIRACAEGDRTLIVVTHHREEAFALADDIAVFESGEILRSGNVEDVFRDPQSEQAAHLLGYRTVVDADVTDESIITPLGQWPANGGALGKGKAAWTMDSVVISPEGNHEGAVESCEFIGRGYRVVLSFMDMKIIGFSTSSIPCSQSARFDMARPPVWITKP
ncbi:ATP-binding cassette domain-containing protein, partial [bacterium]|nr:ATP-binding cassette domain-containing protein [bacterium]